MIGLAPTAGMKTKEKNEHPSLLSLRHRKIEPKLENESTLDRCIFCGKQMGTYKGENFGITMDIYLNHRSQ